MKKGEHSVKDLLCDDFQELAKEYLVRYRSIMDILSKHQEANARVHRGIAKAVTNCGCISIQAEKPQIPEGIVLAELREHMSSHVLGHVCDTCRDVLEAEIGSTLFYLTALCNALDLSMYDILIKEHQRLTSLGLFNFT